MSRTTSRQPRKANIAVYSFLRGETKAQRVEVACPGSSADEQKSQILGSDQPQP